MWQPTTQLTTTVSLAIARRAAGPDTPDQTMPRPDFADRLFDTSRRAFYSMRRCWWKPVWQLEVDGLANVPPHGPVLLCANHTSHLDAAAILAALPRDLALRTTTAAARDVFGEKPLPEFVSRLTTGALLLERASDFARGLRQLEAVLREGRPLILFPEGRRSPDGRLVEFKPGAAMLAMRTAAPIVPIRLDGLHEALPRGAHVPVATKVRVRFGEPIDPASYRREVASGDVDRREAYRRMTDDVRAAIAGMGAE
jgi:1-acyl-sn-glycerol-3-phosphate acyltransferase